MKIALRKKSLVFLLTMVPLLTACEAPSNSGLATQIPRSKIVTAGGADVMIAAPQGFCLDEATVDENRKGAFVFLSDCRQVEGNWHRVPISAVLTASVSPSGLPGAEAGQAKALTALQGFLTTAPGAYTLGKSNNASGVRVVKSFTTDSALYILVEDTSTDTRDGASKQFWRGFTQSGGRLVAISVTGFSRNDPQEERALRIAQAFIQSILDANQPVS